jgi:hypothetical protein
LSYQSSKSCRLVVPSAIDAQHKWKAAKAAYAGHHNEKILAEAREKNPEAAVEPHPKNVPFALESTAQIHPKSVDFLQGLADELSSWVVKIS